MGLRKISGDDMISSHEYDINVRKTLGMPGIECLLRQLRLLYASRLLANGPQALLAMLGAKSLDGHSRIPWTQQLIHDFCVFKAFFPSKLHELPDPCVRPDCWMSFMIDFPMEWKQLVKTYIVYESDYGHDYNPNRTCGKRALEVSPSVPSDAPAPNVAKIAKVTIDEPHLVHEIACQVNCNDDFIPSAAPISHQCSICSVSFPSAKKLICHLRSHNVGNPIQYYIDDSKKCPACGASFAHRKLVLF